MSSDKGPEDSHKLLDDNTEGVSEHSNSKASNQYESFPGKHGASVEKKPQKISGKAWGRVWFKFFRLPFPVFFIIWNEFCERFSYYGMRAVLVLFLTKFLNFNDNTATAMYHAFIVLCYMLPVVGAIISDSCLGKYGTIASLSVLYSIGNVMMSISAIPFDESRVGNIVLTAFALFIIAFGTGGIKPCVSAFGGDQFTEEKVDLLPVFFSVFYFSINAGSLISTLLTPVLRGYVKCFGEDECFPLAFGVPAVLMIISVAIFLAGTRWYIITRPKREAALLFFRVPAAVVYAIYRRLKYGFISNKRTFVHYATPTFSDQFAYDVWLFLRVLVMFLPLPIFWALFDQQGSRWTLQALRMNGRLGEFVILPDQVQSLNPIFIILLIPIFESIVYPLLAKVNIFKKPLQRMATGMAIAGVAFVIAGIVEFYIQSQANTLHEGHARVVISNALNRPANFNYSNNVFNLSSATTYNIIDTSDLGPTLIEASLDDEQKALSYNFNVSERHIIQLFLIEENGQLQFKMNDTIEWFPHGDQASVTIMLGDLRNLFPSDNMTFLLCVDECHVDEKPVYISSNLTSNSFAISQNISVGNYHYLIQDDENRSISNMLPNRLESGGIYTIVLAPNGSDNGVNVDVAAANSPISVSIFLQIPMYFVITVGEVLFSITGLEFAYSQAPVSMKSLCTAAWLLTVAFGNLVVVIVAESTLFSNQAYEFFFFAGAIWLCCIIFSVMAFFYTYVDPSTLLATSSGNRYPQPDGPETDETTKLVGSNGSHDEMDLHENGKSQPSPVHIPQPSDYESEF